MRFKSFFITLLFLSGFVVMVSAQGQKYNKDEIRKSINQLDKSGKPDGFWWEDRKGQKGEDDYTFFGYFNNGVRNGVWYKVNTVGDLLSKEMYRNDVLHGESSYYEMGKLHIVGTYRGLNPGHDFDTIVITHPITGLQMERIIATERGSVKHGIWRYYDPESGALIKEEEYQVDDLIAKKMFKTVLKDSTLSAEEEAKLRKQLSKPAKQVKGRPPGAG